jgi:AcrR family transcriptional regulator
MASVTRKTHNARAARRDEIGRRLLVAVETLLAEGESFTEVSVERLVGEAQISRSTFYVYFEDKGDLLQALTTDVMSEVIDAARAWWELPPEADRADVEAAMRGIVAAYRGHTTLMAAVVEASSYDARVRARFGELMVLSRRELAAHIADGQRRGFVRADVDPEPVAGWLTWMAERGLYQLVRFAGDEASVERLSRALAAIVWNTLYDGARPRHMRRPVSMRRARTSTANGSRG